MSQSTKSRSLIGKASCSRVPEASTDEQLAEAEFASLKAVSLEERRKEAEKPLFLARYE